MTMQTREDQGKARACLVTGSMASVIDRGSLKAWGTLVNKLWADDGSDFSKPTYGARAHGHEEEQAGADKFWTAHPEYDVEHCDFVPYDGPVDRFRGLVGVSPDRLITLNGEVISGLEIKSPINAANFYAHTTPAGCAPHRNPHYAQCMHGALCLKLRTWTLVVHHKDTYVEEIFEWDEAWMDRYIHRLEKFLDFYNSGKHMRVRRLRACDI